MRICPRCSLKYPATQDRCFVDNTVLEQEADPWLGVTLAGRYLIEGLLGEGGMAAVYRARHTLVDRPVAVKIMAEHLKGNAQLTERFRREAKNAAQLEHPNIIQIHDHGETEAGDLYMVMELLRGRPLSDSIAAGPMSADDTCAFGLQMATGLSRAHDFDVLHRDLKPDNVFISGSTGGRRGIVKLLDFGIGRSMNDSRLTAAGEIFGTPQYMAPERLTNIDAGASADLYALGVIYFEMITGRLPFESEEVTGLFIKHMQEQPPKPSELAPHCPRRLEELILSLLEKNARNRPVDAHQVVNALKELAPKDSAPSRGSHAAAPRVRTAPTLPPTTLERWARRAALFETMLTRAYPAGNAPAESRQQLDEIRASLTQVNRLRSAGLTEQRKLERLEKEAKENRARMGHAVHVLAEDLSSAREAARQAEAEVAPYFDAESAAKTAYEKAAKSLEAAGGYRVVAEPDAAMVKRLQEIAESMDRWVLAHGASSKAHTWVEAKRREVQDLEFQVQAMRVALDREEATYAENKAVCEAVLTAHGASASSVEQRLTHLAGLFCRALRPRHDLGDLFAQLESEGT